MKRIVHFFFLAGVCVALGACSYFDTGAGVDVSGQPPQDEIISSELETHTPSPLDSAPSQNMAEIANRLSDGRVEVFPLDDAAVPAPVFSASVESSSISVEPVAPPPVNPAGKNPPGYPNVEIFPLDDAMAGLAGGAAPTPFPVSLESGLRLDPVPSPVPATVYFDYDSTALQKESVVFLADLARSYSGQGTVEVVGHASPKSSIRDPVKRKMVNLKISMDRAFAVARALMQGGIPAENIETKAFGEVRPPAETDESAGRRVEIFGLSGQ